MNRPGREEDPLGRIEAAGELARVATTGTGWRRRTARILVIAVLAVLGGLFVVGMVQTFAG